MFALTGRLESMLIFPVTISGTTNMSSEPAFRYGFSGLIPSALNSACINSNMAGSSVMPAALAFSKALKMALLLCCPKLNSPLRSVPSPFGLLATDSSAAPIPLPIFLMSPGAASLNNSGCCAFILSSISITAVTCSFLA